MNVQTRFLLTALIPFALCSAPAQEAPPAGPLDMAQVVRLVLEHDPSLDDLRVELGVSEGRARAIRYWDDPEVRFYYNHEGDERVPDAYSETLRQTRSTSGSETQNTRGTTVENRTETRLGGKNGTEVRREQETRTAQESRRDSFSERETEVTTREYLPRRDGVLIRDTTTLQTSGSSSRATDESFRTSGVETRTDEPNAIRPLGSGSSRERQTTTTSGRVTRVEETERLYAQSPYEGSDRYSVQLRLQPRNPWEVSRLLKQAKAEVSLAEFQLQAAQAQLAAEVRRKFREVVGAVREAELARLRVDVKKRDLEFFQTLQQSGAPVVRQVAEKRAALARENVRLREAEARAEALRDDLALRAGVEDANRLQVSGGALPLLDFAGLNTNLVIQAAVETHPELGAALLELKARELGVEAARAARIPWFTVLAVEAGYEEQYGERVSDDYGIFAGVSLPVFSWLDEQLGAEDKAGAEALKQRIGRLQDRVAGQVANHLRRLAGSNRALADFRRTGAAETEELAQARKALEAGGEDAHRAAIALEEATLDVLTAEIEVEQRQADAILVFEQALGADLELLFADTPAK
jgi:outer membrane protein TolC